MVPPAHGTAMVERGRYFPNYPATNPHSPCKVSSQDGVGLFSRSAPDYSGPDLIEVESIAPNGWARLIDDHLDVR